MLGVVAVDCGIVGMRGAGVTIVGGITCLPGEELTKVDVQDLQCTEDDG